MNDVFMWHILDRCAVFTVLPPFHMALSKKRQMNSYLIQFCLCDTYRVWFNDYSTVLREMNELSKQSMLKLEGTQEGFM